MESQLRDSGSLRWEMLTIRRVKIRYSIALRVVKREKCQPIGAGFYVKLKSYNERGLSERNLLFE